MAEHRLSRAGEHRPVRGVPDDYDAPAGEDDAWDEDEDEDEEYEEGAAEPASADAQPDVLLDVPVLKVEEIHLEVNDLKARVSLQAEVLKLLRLHVGADVSLGRVALDITGVNAVAQLKVRLDKVEGIIARVMTTIDNNPQILTDLTRGLGEAAGDVGRGAGEALEGVGRGAGEALEEVGEGTGSAVESVGGGAGEAVNDLGQAGGRAVEEVVEETGDIADDVLDTGRGAVGSGRKPRQTRPAAGGGQPRRVRRPRPE